jgi:hypothetical protein
MSVAPIEDRSPAVSAVNRRLVLALSLSLAVNALGVPAAAAAVWRRGGLGYLARRLGWAQTAVVATTAVVADEVRPPYR